MDKITEKIISFLKSNSGYVSGEQMSHHLSISRSAIWKHIQELRDLGYTIEAIPHLGYRILKLPDRLLPYEITYNLVTKFMGKKLYYFETVTSTMDIAYNLAKQNEPEGTVVIAESQTRARGRLKRKWFCWRYKGIYFSFILKPQIHPNQAFIFNLLSSVAVVEAIKETTDIQTELKWPNDVILNGKKLAGILTEIEAEMEKVHFIIIGIGINVNNSSQQLIEPAISLYEYKKENINRLELMRSLLIKLEEYYLLFKKKGARFILDRWRMYSTTLGRMVKIIQDKKVLLGLAQDVDEEGNLLLRKETGLIERINAGDLFYCR
jgi:BirA family biotin operon repressor/biotin-[acetyl-CoA-carboxylase] ligase